MKPHSISVVASIELQTGIRTKPILFPSLQSNSRPNTSFYHTIPPPDLDGKHRMSNTSVRSAPRGQCDIVILQPGAEIQGLTALPKALSSPIIVTQIIQRRTPTEKYRKITPWNREPNGQMKPIHWGDEGYKISKNSISLRIRRQDRVAGNMYRIASVALDRRLRLKLGIRQPRHINQ